LRESKIRNRQQQDTNSKRYSKSSYIERNLMKSKKQYSTASLDMVSAYMDNPNTVDKISEENLPDTLKGKSKVEIEKVLESKKVERVALQKEIRDLEVKRDTYIAEKTTSTDKDLGSAIITSIRKQATENGFIFKK
ncbi:MAG: hypothetical protein GQ531_04755, partial [Sulfurovum sp.]|nr:hypothetical protein [Sulfurovum sp.]